MRALSLIIVLILGYMPLVSQTLTKSQKTSVDLVHYQDYDLPQLNTTTGFSDDFESYPDFNLQFPPWTTVDVDNSNTYSIENVSFPNEGQPMAFIIFNPSQTTPPITDAGITPHSGSKFAASFAAVSGPNNDWLISPQLTLGTNSSVSFWVKSYTAQYGLERYKVGVSTTNTNPSSFTIISGSSYLTAPADQWQQKTFDLNAYNGQSVYVAIQCVSDDAFIFMVDDFVLTTTASANLPTVSTAEVSNITATTALSGGTVSADGGASVTARGIVWSTTTNPTITDHTGMTNDGSGTGSFSSALTGLSPATVYYLRAYATNSVGTAYGQQISFTTAAGGETGILTGKVTDAMDGSPVEGAIVNIAGLSTTTDNQGNYTITGIPPGTLAADFNASVTSGSAPLHVQFFDQSSDGSHMLSCTKTGYITYTNNNVVVPPGETLTLNISLSPTMTEGDIRFVINWGATPRDLDSHLKTPEIEGSSYHVYYSYKGNDTAPPYAKLDHDITSGYGPETMTIYQLFPGTYHYYIYNYTGSPDITTSNAVVQVYSQTGLLYTLQVPTTGEGRYWHVCDVNGNNGQITIINSIQTSAPGDKNQEMPPKQPETRDVISWLWDFGDGTNSTERNPVKTYSNPGTYTVSLTVGNGSTTHTTSKEDYIHVSGTGTGTLTGKVTDAMDGSPVEGAVVSIAGLSTTTDSQGNYSISGIPPGTLTSDFNASVTEGEIPLIVQFFDQSSDGSHMLSCTKTGYITYTNNNVIVPQGETITMDISLSPTMTEGDLRFVINWGATPRDLDSHLKTPEIEGNSYHVYYSYKGNDTAPPYAKLDHDITSGYGPETMTIYQLFPGTYHYYIYNYTGSPDITTSNAVVQVYSQTGLLYTLQVPTTGEGRYWHVCDVNGNNGQITIINSIQTSAPGDKNQEMPPKQPETRDVISWLWDFGDGTNSTERNPVKTYDEVGVYTVSLTISNGTNTITKVKENYIHASSSGLLTPSANQLVVYPNPARDKLTIKGFETGTIEIYDLTGKLLHHTQIQDGTIDISTLEQGIFLIMLKTKDQTFTTRLLKE
ncbi:MAG: PKD domain-containing protein [Bacteroidales bacterium]|jgi:PKD repeat protein/uncharacterized protein YfaP (DUF2135 family)|nr:PKD domain-containing protein [Bacteroidales bacterium]MDY0368879.1 PKD domain-containing protein [Bacteroidales bacterium]